MALIYQEKQDLKRPSERPGALGDEDWPTGISSHRRTLNRLGVAEFELENNSRALKHLVDALTILPAARRTWC
jgi:hypothetical protein